MYLIDALLVFDVAFIPAAEGPALGVQQSGIWCMARECGNVLHVFRCVKQDARIR